MTFRISLVGVIRLERTTTCTPCKYASQLRHTPFNFAVAKVEKKSIRSPFSENYFSSLKTRFFSTLK